AFLNKPVDQQALLAVLRCHLQPAEEGDAALHSEVEELVISDELRQIFLDRLTTMVPSLKSALRYEQWDEVRSIAHNIKGSGSSFGYPELTAMGKAACEAIDYEQLEQLTELTTPLLERMKQILD
ncbi:MAG: Hpt domain-containing protein, partial [Gammaproteobacteria bacterium]|nr:Hpt domain-containing protein [Gammaproteobacteria bacterium]MBT4328972.1 Hpt domain-containing protein [Gammaproteobacteria bacterium]MBT4608042.1 Hpt domain-containing protein [Thiotrichales bacterium]MBT6080621.1 Hpt domain-containing protein [Gammaproteobacteria bacterium]MBT7022695.1 Hpt domain-containing protein [Gammaproteobacteria bacterium]